MRLSPRPLLAALAALCLSTMSCAISLSNAHHSPAPFPSYTPEPIATTAPPTPVSLKRPLFVLQLTDLHGQHPADIAVRITGPRNDTVLSDAMGRVRIDDVPGTYALRVVKGCEERVLVRDGGSINVTLPPGTSHTETIDVDWKHRFAPASPVYKSSSSAGWRIGEQIDMRYALIDRCKGVDALTPHAVFPTYTFRLSGGLEVVGSPRLVADDAGYGHISVRCNKTGNPGMHSYDATNPSDTVDFLIGLNGNRPYCVNF